MLIKQVMTWRYYAVECSGCRKRSIAMLDRLEARRMARNDGWARVPVGTGLVDLCPECKRKYAARQFDTLEEVLASVAAV